MKRAIASILIVAILGISLVGCGNTKVINGVEYDTYGLLNQNEKQNPNIQYELILGNLIWGVVLVETVIAPVYFFGFSLFEPVGPKSDIKGKVVR
ncbi:MAG: hypothetical protein A3I44_02915 [Candidatus Sungbacteria bacterium RIFCSPLOWO2_02_FULL_51_17]|uniref:Lipoprotein n=1 Tax=Candidatus Sungbacteria bacterium RIFCSPHIGHO2_02_FULL_51_29 TaxID=1802273 RepID=A0A1G2KZE3_9BACT|nr:MAG: hypothetical protein A2676_00570 [Candidatus Sungbacteria bacterium RIFCSPHIGHO2_01_FULL_51_22]OHA03882.1 MAG: hypothetical protein A3C16_01200 [Candidatus Sungbacteria bacterium RIFCSPHIGHO2_02_FULL_51_29]OHA05991.1 MAG: hypothetical protein A3B29_03670 [Candidatus Sungbacteria bacterium RIFCSPLOWO2_01_FULL_51_34]OHA10846.1 MAG: hypothetical protein A3I44_02915 [Candidatus Sungbacteria bacterium RIFCSPLOWO2_02_FULL_51_17]